MMRAAAVWMGLVVACGGDKPQSVDAAVECRCILGESTTYLDKITLRCLPITRSYSSCPDRLGPPGCLNGQLPGEECPHACDGLDEEACMESATTTGRCAVARRYDAFYAGSADSFLSCYPRVTSNVQLCYRSDVYGCHGAPNCSALYRDGRFVECIPQVEIAGTCTGTLTCADAAPYCPPNRTPGIADGCYTGACIPNELCT